MNLLISLAFLFFIGCLFGWCLEVFYRRFFSDANPERKWINPGFCTGPYLPLYGSGLCILYLIASIEKLSPGIPKWLIFIFMAISMTLIEYLAGFFCLKFSHIRLWDYSNEWGNIQGLICPKFSVYWSLIGAGYYFLIHPRIIKSLEWLSNNLTFSFFIGMFFGIFIIDFVHSANLVSKIRVLATEYDVVVRFEDIKLEIKQHYEDTKQKYHFFKPFKSDIPIKEHISNLIEKVKEEGRDLLAK